MSKYLNKLKRILVLTPDSTGSTYFQRSLTLYLNYNNIPCKNYTDISKLGSLSNIVNTLSKSKLSIIGRASPANVHQKDIGDNHLSFCNNFFDDLRFDSAIKRLATSSFINLLASGLPSAICPSIRILFVSSSFLTTSEKVPSAI